MSIKSLRGLSEAILPTMPNEAGISEGCVLLAVGPNKTARKGARGGRNYTAQFIEAQVASGRFDEALCNVDHPSLSEAKDRPEGSLSTLAAVACNARFDPEYVNPETGAKGAAIGDLRYLGTDAGRNMREAFADEAVRRQCGLSIYWAGGVKVKREKVGESYVDVPQELVGDGKFCVDFVTRPNAGGRVGPLRESEDDMELADVTLEMLETERPDLVASIKESAAPIPPPAPEVKSGMSEAERTEFESLKRRALRSDAKDIVTAKLTEAALPEKAAGLVLAHFAEAECADAAVFAPLVEAEITRVKEAFAGLVEAGRVRGVAGESKPEAGADGQKIDVMKDLREASGDKPADKQE